MGDGQIAYWIAIGLGGIVIGWSVRSFWMLLALAPIWASIVFLIGKAAGVVQ